MNGVGLLTFVLAKNVFQNNRVVQELSRVNKLLLLGALKVKKSIKTVSVRVINYREQKNN